MPNNISRLPDSGGSSLSLEQAIAAFGAHQHAMERDQENMKRVIEELQKDFLRLRDRVAAVENSVVTLADGGKHQGERLGNVEAAISRLSEETNRLLWQTDQIVAVGLSKLESRDEAQAVQIETINSWMKGVIMVGSALVLVVTLREPIADLLKSNAPRFSPPADAAGENYNPVEQYPD